jgi:hypothetical protein
MIGLVKIPPSVSTFAVFPALIAEVFIGSRAVMIRFPDPQHIQIGAVDH